MIKRTLFFNNPYHLSTRLRQLVITDKKTGEKTTAPIEDLGFVVLDHREITFTQSVLSELAANNTAVVICDSRHMPASMLFHLDTHQVQNERFRAQVSASEPLKKQLWQQTVKAKLRNQASVLDQRGGPGDALRRLAARVRSGDPDNLEGQGARRYWKALFGPDFKREREGAPPNPSLNYIYAILRAAVARALCGSGLLPTLGIHHHNRYNAYCLADDIMEPFRPFADALVREEIDQNPNYHNLTPENKARLLGVLTTDTLVNGKLRPLSVGLAETTASLAACFVGKARKIKYPAWPPAAKTKTGK